MTRRAGGYPKGIAKRAEILEVALELIGERGYNAATIRELAEAVGLSKTGLLHHFGTKEELFAEILRQRDARELAAAGPVTDPWRVLPQVVSHNADVPGLVQLYTRFTAEATDPKHLGHQYIADRYARLRSGIEMLIEQLRTAGRIRPDADARHLAIMIIAALDGLQIQWLYDSSIDMSAALASLFDILVDADRATP